MIPNQRNRLDLSEWVIHFVHQRKPENDPTTLEDAVEAEFSPTNKVDLRPFDYFDDVTGHHILDRYEEINEESEIEEDADALTVLKKILKDGYIHSGWSFRNDRATIYGLRSAVCFTEMPLYALVEYAKSRSVTGLVDSYGIAFNRGELFQAGARQVIYGLSGDKSEIGDKIYPRILDPKCGIGYNEQYRFVDTNIKPEGYGSLDWTHEREWRWPLPYGEAKVPGLPILLNDWYAGYRFTHLIIIVPTDDEQDEILNWLKNLYDTQRSVQDGKYSLIAIQATQVLSLESLKNVIDNEKLINLNDIPLAQLKLPPMFKVDKALEDKVRKAVNDSLNMGCNSIEEYVKENPEYAQSGSCGFAYVCTDIVSEISEALLIADCARIYGDNTYRIFFPTIKNYQRIDLYEHGAEVAADYLTAELGQKFYVTSRLD